MTDRDSQRGGILFQLMLIKLGIMAAAGLMIFVLLARMYRPSSAAAGAGSATAAVEPGAPDEPVDLGTGFLVCVDLPGVAAPKTPALDRRVARKLEAVRADIAAQGLAPLRFTYGFRSTPEQIAVNPGGNLKAEPGTSPHEAGRAVDVVGMKVRADRGTIIATFRRHGWRWLGMGDPPHFEVNVETIGEPNKLAMIRKAQADYNAGNPAGCHRGRRGAVPVPGGAIDPEERRRRIGAIYG